MQLSDMVELARGGNGFEVVPGEVDLLPREHSYLTRKKRKTRKNIKLKQQMSIVNLTIVIIIEFNFKYSTHPLDKFKL